MEIQRYVRILKGRKWVVILTTLVTLVVVTLGTISMTPTYSTSALVRVTTGLADSVTYTDLTYAERLIKTSMQLPKSRLVHSQACRGLFTKAEWPVFGTSASS